MAKDKKDSDVNFLRTGFFWILILLGLVWASNALHANFSASVKKMTYSEFYYLLQNNLDNPVIDSVKKTDNLIEGDFIKGAYQPMPDMETNGADNQDVRHGGIVDATQKSTPPAVPTKFYLYVPEDDKDLLDLLRANVRKFEVDVPKTLWANLLYSLGPVILFVAFLWYISYKGNQMGSRVWSFGRAKTQTIEKEKLTKVTFKDVAGVDEAKEELTEVIEFLKEPKRFQRLGGRIPKGVILVGPPGCGKTLLAKAVAGEAEVPFFSISGSDFVEMFVGVGASRVRDLFDQAKRASKTSGKGCIVFIDEIDAVGRQRFAGIGGGHDEREQTLNQLLVEMDGFHSDEAVIVVAATNRPDVLDPALLRPGRFDRHIVIHPPDIKGREEILRVHTKKLKLSASANLEGVAKQTPGFSGADLANLCNEAALLAARQNKESIEQSDLMVSIERVMMGPEKKSRVMLKREKELTAYHESGHALLSLLLPEVDPMTKVSIIPRGLSGGYTFTPPKEDRHYKSKKELLGEIVVALGGRASEEITFSDITTGAMRDLEEVSASAKRIVCDYGMSERIGNLTLGRSHGPIFLGRDLVEEKDYSEDTARIIDQEVKRIVDTCYERSKKLLLDNIDKLKALSGVLLEKEVLDVTEVRAITGLKDEDNSSKA